MIRTGKRSGPRTESIYERVHLGGGTWHALLTKQTILRALSNILLHNCSDHVYKVFCYTYIIG